MLSSASVPSTAQKFLPISRNQQGNYEINVAQLDVKQDIVFLCGKEKIAVWYRAPDEVSHFGLKIFSSEIVNIVGAIASEAVYIESAGKLYFQENVHAMYLNIEALEVYFQGVVTSPGGIHITVEKKLYFNERIVAGFLNIIADTIHFTKPVKTQEDVHITARGTLHVTANFISKGSVVLTSKDTYLHQSLVAKRVSITAEKTIINNANVYGMKGVIFKALYVEHNGKIISRRKHSEVYASKKFFCDPASILSVNQQLTIRADECVLAGHINAQQGYNIKVKTLHAQCKMDGGGQHHILAEEWYCYEGTKINIIHTALNQQSEIRIEKGFGNAAGTYFSLCTVTEALSLFYHQQNQKPIIFSLPPCLALQSGEISLQGTHVIGNHLTIGVGATVSMKDAWFQTNAVMLFSGNVSYQNSTLEAPLITHTEESKIEYEAVEIKATKEFRIRGDGKFSRTNISSTEVTLTGNLVINNVVIDSKRVIFYPLSIQVEKLGINTEHLTLESIPLQVPHEYKELIATTQVFNTRGHIVLTHSQVNAKDDRVSQSSGVLQLEDSELSSEGQFLNNNKLTLNHSILNAKCFYNSGEAILNKSVLSVKTATHVGQQIQTTESIVKLEDQLFIDKNADLNLELKSALQGKDAKIITNQGQITIQKSMCEAKDIYALSDSSIVIKEALAEVKDTFLELGKCSLESSKLQINEISQRGELTVQASHLKAQRIDMLGPVIATQSQVDINCLCIRPDGQLKLIDSSLSGKEMMHQGYLLSKTSQNVEKEMAQEAQEKPQEHALPATLTLNQLVTSYNSKIEANDLTLSVGSWRHQGSLDLTGELVASGMHFRNEGYIITKGNIQLGYNTLLNEGGRLLSTKHLQIKAGAMVNLFGAIDAASLESSSFISLNTGITKAAHIQTNALFSVNTGLILPSFNFEEMMQLFSVKNTLKGAAKVAVSAFFPRLNSLIHLYNASSNIYSTVNTTISCGPNFNIQALLNAPLYEWADYTCRFANSAMAATYLSRECASLYQQGKTWYQQQKDSEPQLGRTTVNPLHHETSSLYRQSLSGMVSAALSAARTYGPTVSSQSVGDVNQGITLSHTIQELNYISHNGGVKGASDLITIEAAHHVNNNFIGSGIGFTHLKGKVFTNAGTTLGVNGVHVNYEWVNLKKDSQKTYHRWHIDTQQLLVEGTHHFAASRVKTGRLLAYSFHTPAQMTFIENSQLSAKRADLLIDMTLDQSQFTVDSLKQRKKIKIEGEAGNLQIAGEHVMQKGASLELDYHARANTAGQILMDDAKIHVTHGATNIVKGRQEIKAGAEIHIEKKGKNICHTLHQEGGTLKATGEASGIEVVECHAMGEHARLQLSDHAYEIANSLQSDGETKLCNDAYLGVTDKLFFSKQAKTCGENALLKARTIVDEGNTIYSGTCGFIAEDYQHAGRIQVSPDSDSSSILHVKSHTARFEGEAKDAECIFKVDHMTDPAAFALGNKHYEKYQFKSLNLITQDTLQLTGAYQRSSNLYLEAPHISSEVSFKGEYDVGFKSTKENIIIKRNIAACNISIESAKAFDNEVTLNASQMMLIKSEAIKNIHGIINGQTQTLLKATVGNIENYGGQISSGGHVQLVAAKDVLNICHETDCRDRYDTVKRYAPAVIQGGVKVFIYAKGYVNNDASIITSTGDNCIEGEQGVRFKERHHAYINTQYTNRGFLRFNKKRVTETQVQLQGSYVSSLMGKNIISSKQGAIEAIATKFISKEGSHLYADNDIQLMSLKTKRKSSQLEKRWWGLTKHKHSANYQEAAPVAIYDLDGLSQVHAEKGDVFIAGGAVFLGKGDFEIKAKRNILLSRDILNHSIRIQQRSVIPSFFGFAAYQALKQKKDIWQAMIAEDPTLAKIDALRESISPMAVVAHTWNLGVDFLNVVNRLSPSPHQPSLGSMFLQRYGLGGVQGFNPTVTFSFNQTKNRTCFQTLGSGKIDRVGNISLAAGEKIRLENGVSINGTTGSLSARQIAMNAASLATETHSKTNSLKLGLTLKSLPTSVGIGQTQLHTRDKSHVNAQFCVEGRLDIQTTTLAMQGASITAGTVAGHIDNADISSLQDQHRSSTFSYSLDSSGMLSVSQGEKISLQAQNVSGIYAREGINQDEKIFAIDELHLKGSKIVASGKMNPFTKEIKVEEIRGRENGNNISVTTNINDLRSAVQRQPVLDSNKPAIPTAAFSYSEVDYQATQQAAIHGMQGTSLSRETISGSLNTSNNSYQILKNHKEQFRFDVPIISREFLATIKNNFVKKTNQTLPMAHQPEAVNATKQSSTIASASKGLHGQKIIQKNNLNKSTYFSVVSLSVNNIKSSLVHKARGSSQRIEIDTSLFLNTLGNKKVDSNNAQENSHKELGNQTTTEPLILDDERLQPLILSVDTESKTNDAILSTQDSHQQAMDDFISQGIKAGCEKAQNHSFPFKLFRKGKLIKTVLCNGLPMIVDFINNFQEAREAADLHSGQTAIIKTAVEFSMFSLGDVVNFGLTTSYNVGEMCEKTSESLMTLSQEFKSMSHGVIHSSLTAFDDAAQHAIAGKILGFFLKLPKTVYDKSLEVSGKFVTSIGEKIERKAEGMRSEIGSASQGPLLEDVEGIDLIQTAGKFLKDFVGPMMSEGAVEVVSDAINQAVDFAKKIIIPTNVSSSSSLSDTPSLASQKINPHHLFAKSTEDNLKKEMESTHKQTLSKQP